MTELQNSLQRLAEIAGLLKRDIVERKLRYRMKVYKDVFVGRRAVDYMVQKGLAENRADAVKLGNMLLSEGFVRHVCGDHCFKDEYLFYNVMKATPYSFPMKRSVESLPAGPLGTLSQSSRKLMELGTGSGQLAESQHDLSGSVHGGTASLEVNSQAMNKMGILEILIAQCNEKANFLDMEINQLMDSVADTRECLEQLKLRCDSIQSSYEVMLLYCYHQARAMICMAIVFAVSLGVSNQSPILFTVTLVGILILGRDAFAVMGNFPPSPPSSTRSSSSGKKTTGRTIRGNDRYGDNKREGVKSDGKKSQIKYDGQVFRHLRLVDKLKPTLHNENGENKGDENSSATRNPIDSTNHLEFNSTTGIPFETNHFKGKVIFKLRPTDESELSGPYQQYFGPRARKFSLMIQGKFKREIGEGTIVWLGAEVGHCDKKRLREDRMKLGFMRRTVCKILLNTINLMRGAILHYSFGDGQQLPHITLPLYIAADTFVETDDGLQPPKIGVRMFPEDENLRRIRRRTSEKTKRFSPNATYSFSLHNSNLDLFNWRVVGIPGIKSMDLKNYWDDMPLRIVGYTTKGAFATPHSEENREYLFCFELTNLNLGPPSSRS